MTNQSAWIGGQLDAGAIGYQNAFGAELNVSGGIPNGASILSSIAFDNTAGLDQFMDISFVGALSASSAVVAGAALSFFLAVLQNDGVTYGDGRLSPGGAPVVYQPILNPLPGIPFVAGTITNLVGDSGLITLRPRKFALILTNNTAFTIAPSGNHCMISTYRQNLNA